MHKLAEKMAECLKAKVEGMGIDNIEGENLIELRMWVDIIKDIAEYDKAMREIEEMDEEGEEDDGRRGYRGQPRDSMGRYTSRRGRRRGRRGYEEPMYHMTPEMYKMHDPEYWRDMDREEMGRMYYDGGMSGSMGGSTSGRGGQSSGGSQGGMSGGSSYGGGNRGYEENYGNRGRDYREGRSGEKRKGYMEAKEMGKEKGEKMKELEAYMKELGSDVTEMIEGASPEEKSMLKSKMQTLLQKIQ